MFAGKVETAVAVLVVCAAIGCAAGGLPWLPDGAISRMGLDEVADLAFSYDGQYLVVAGTAVVNLFDSASRQLLASLPLPEGGLVTAIEFSPQANVLASATYFARIRVWDIGDMGITETWSVQGDVLATPEVSIAFSPDGHVVAFGNGGGSAVLRDAATGETLKTMDAHHDSVVSLDFSPDGSLLATSGGPAKIWDVATGELTATLQERSGSVLTLDFSPDGTLLATGLDNLAMEVWQVATGDLLFSHRLEDSVTAVAFSPDGSQVVAVEGGHLVHVYNIPTGLTAHLFGGHEEPTTAIAFSPDGATFATGSADGTIIFWDTSEW